jgi:hypothetical protein
MAVTAARIGRTRSSGEHAFFVTMTVAMSATVLVGFARSFFLRPLFPAWPSPGEPIFYVHGAVFASWFALLVAQTSLVATGRLRLHRRLGVLGAAIAAAMVALGTVGGLIAAHRPTGFVGIPVPPLVFLVVPIFDMATFAALIVLAIRKRGDPQSHKRLVLIASINLLTAAVARWPVINGTGVLVYFAVTDLFLVPLIVWDLRSRGRLQPVTLWGGGWLVASQPLRLVIASTPAWMAFAHWAVGRVS